MGNFFSTNHKCPDCPPPLEIPECPEPEVCPDPVTCPEPISDSDRGKLECMSKDVTPFCDILLDKTYVNYCFYELDVQKEARMPFTEENTCRSHQNLLEQKELTKLVSEHRSAADVDKFKTCLEAKVPLKNQTQIGNFLSVSVPKNDSEKMARAFDKCMVDQPPERYRILNHYGSFESNDVKLGPPGDIFKSGNSVYGY